MGCVPSRIKTDTRGSKSNIAINTSNDPLNHVTSPVLSSSMDFNEPDPTDPDGDTAGRLMETDTLLVLGKAVKINSMENLQLDSLLNTPTRSDSAQFDYIIDPNHDQCNRSPDECELIHVDAVCNTIDGDGFSARFTPCLMLGVTSKQQSPLMEVKANEREPVSHSYLTDLGFTQSNRSNSSRFESHASVVEDLGFSIDDQYSTEAHNSNDRSDTISSEQSASASLVTTASNVVNGSQIPSPLVVTRSNQMLSRQENISNQNETPRRPTTNEAVPCKTPCGDM